MRCMDAGFLKRMLDCTDAPAFYILQESAFGMVCADVPKDFS